MAEDKQARGAQDRRERSAGRSVSAGEVAELLRQHGDALCREVLPRGHREGQEWVEASTSEGGLGDSLKVNLRRGVFKHFGGGGKGGDLMDLVAYVNFGGDKKKAFAWARSWLGLDNMDSGRLQQQRLAARRAAVAIERQTVADINRKRRRAHAMWLSGVPIKGTLVQTYLEHRGIEFARLGWVPGALRFVPALEHRDGVSWPAMLAIIVNVHGQPISVHRTWLQPDGTGKAPVTPAKMTYAPYAGGLIRLWRGVSVDAETGEIRRGHRWRDMRSDQPESIVLTEGIEDGLSVACAVPERRVAATVSLGNLASIALPEAIADVIWVKDNDAHAQAAAALAKGFKHLWQSGRRVKVVHIGRPAEKPHG